MLVSDANLEIFYMRLALFFTLFLIVTAPGHAQTDSQQTMAWPDGTRYVGSTVNGKRDGQGTIYWQDGTRYIGGFKENQRHGPGMMILPDGTTLEGDFLEGRLISDEDNTDAQPSTDAQPTTALSASEIGAITSTLDLWAAAWMAQNADQYLSLYSDAFELAPGESRVLWEMNRRERVSAPSYIQIDLAYDAFTRVTETTVDVKLRQSYRSDRYREISNKTLRLAKEASGWRIIGEQQR